MWLIIQTISTMATESHPRTPALPKLSEKLLQPTDVEFGDHLAKQSSLLHFSKRVVQSIEVAAL